MGRYEIFKPVQQKQGVITEKYPRVYYNPFSTQLYVKQNEKNLYPLFSVL